MRVAITTLGCKVNQYDSAVIQGRLEADRHSIVPFEEKADIYIINACTVTDRADWEARQLIRRAKRLSPQARVLVTGCYAQVSPQEVARVPDVNFVVGLNRLEDLVRFVRDADGDHETKISVGNPRDETGVRVLAARGLPNHTRAFLKIEEGCNYSCTYCIIPIARGRSRSVPEEEVLRQVHTLAQEGFKELVLTGIHLGGYGHDLKPKTDLVRLLERIADSRLIPRIRLSSLDPREVAYPLLRLLAESDVLCPHLHICIQAGEDRILRKMRRNYDTSYYRDLIWRTRDMLPTASLGTDLIVGFPGETGEEFERSIAFLDSLPLTYFHVFPYSIRTGTVAAALPDQVPLQIKKERARRFRELGARKKKEFYRQFIGTQVPVLVEQAVDEVKGLYKGYSRNYLPVLLHGKQVQVNHEMAVTLEGLEGGRLLGRAVESP
ncbi:MAG: tRNA (N(6)-L-threonylcarbamoyladenosine(37)-C(2))-methylthiotransferase MtaB [Deltaproteobacteria bacterium]|nr:tRNA (N(6)-L-threonylcarbamoyladenosine(37)-C(2))-methylthiotransferase MtaB [Deltaproteobacteria bacterium]